MKTNVTEIIELGTLSYFDNVGNLCGYTIHMQSLQDAMKVVANGFFVGAPKFVELKEWDKPSVFFDL